MTANDPTIPENIGSASAGDSPSPSLANEPSPPATAAEEEKVSQGAEPPPHRRILIGSQRDPAAYRVRRRDWKLVEQAVPDEAAPSTPSTEGGENAIVSPPSGRRRRHPPRRGQRRPRRERPPRGPTAPITTPAQTPAVPSLEAVPLAPAAETSQAAAMTRPEVAPAEMNGAVTSPATLMSAAATSPVAAQPTPSLTPPSLAEGVVAAEQSVELPPQPPPEAISPAVVRSPGVPRPLDAAELPPSDLSISVPLTQPAPLSEEDELQVALDNQSLDELILGEEDKSRSSPLEPETRLQGRVIAVGRGEVFFDLGRREQGSAPLHLFPTPPEPGMVFDLIVQRLNVEEGLYEVSLCHAAVPVEDWSQVHEGMLVEARVTGHNAGGLECQVNNLRGFIPFSQIALYRVEDPAQFVGQSLLCLVTEANQQRRNLVLSRRAVLEREREEARQQFFQALQPGEVREGLVRKLMPFGAFVDLGGVDGLLPISQLAWHRVEHPSEILSEGQRIKVKIERVDPTTGKISLAYRDLLESPWVRAAEKYPPNTIVRGKVRNITTYGAFVELEPGIEGLLHISELSHKKVWKVTEVVKEGDEVDVLVLAIDAANQRISLSMRALSQTAEEEKAPEAAAAEEPTEPPPPEKPKKSKPAPPLTGGLGRTKGWNRFGLKW